MKVTIKMGRLAFIITLVPTLVYYILLHPGYRIIGDTEEYFYFFNSLTDKEDILLYGLEFITPLLMFLAKHLGLSFEWFLTLSVLTWLIPIFKLSNYSGILLTLSMMLFLLSDLFSANLVWLLRQYYAALFFVMLLLSQDRLLRKLYCVLAICSHLSSLLWLPLISKKVSYWLQHTKTHLIMLYLTLLTFAFNIPIVNLFVDWMSNIALGLEYTVILNKVAFYSSGEDVSAVSGQMIALCMINLFILFTLLTKERNNSYALRYLSLAFYQTCITLILRENIVAANRFGFFGFYFAVPILILSITYGLGAHGRFLHKGYFFTFRSRKKKINTITASKI